MMFSAMYRPLISLLYILAYRIVCCCNIFLLVITFIFMIEYMKGILVITHADCMMSRLSNFYD